MERNHGVHKVEKVMAILLMEEEFNFVKKLFV